MTVTLPPTVSADESSPTSPTSPGDRELARGGAIGRYLVIERIGEGGMGVVYKAYDPLDRSVALKLVRADPRNPDHRRRLRARLVREAQTLAQLSHPNVVTVHDVGTHDDDVFVAMELIDGTTLTRVLVEQAPAPARVVELFVAAARGLAAAHDVAIVHRDFKPDNVIVGRDRQVRVLDFGLARSERDASAVIATGARAGDPIVTDPGVVAGTPAYMAPEQGAGRELDARADQFSFCVSLYEALFATRPEPDPPEPPARTAAGAPVPRRIRAALVRGLARDPARRHPTMHALIAALTPPLRARWVVPAIAVAAAAVAAVVIVATRTDPAARCDGAASRLAGVWDPARRATLDAALRRHGDAAIPATVERVLDQYTGAWQAMYTASCRATHVRGEQSAELLDLRTECLDRRLAEVRHLTELLGAADPDITRRAVASVHALAPIEDCANITALREPVAPRDPVLSRTARETFTELRALFLIGKYADVDRGARDVMATAERAGDPWLAANALYLQARATRQLGDPAGAEAALYRAIEIAEAGRASAVVADAWMTLAWIAGEDLGHHDDALRLAGIARGVMGRVGGNPALEASLEDFIGVLYLGRGDLEPAREHLERGLALREQLFGRDDSDYAASLQHLALLERASGHGEVALQMLHRAREIAESELGLGHPDVLAMLGTEGAALYELGRYGEASELLEHGLAIVDASVGPDTELAASFLTNLGLAHGKLQRFDEARAAFERSRAIVERNAPDGLRAGTLYLNLALLLNETGEVDAARTYADRAVTLFDKLLGPKDPDLAMALEALGTSELRSKQAGAPAAAIAAFERALAVRTAAGSSPGELAMTRFDLARSIVAAGGDRRHARALAEQAKADLDQAGDAEGSREVAAWLAR